MGKIKYKNTTKTTQTAIRWGFGSLFAIGSVVSIVYLAVKNSQLKNKEELALKNISGNVALELQNLNENRMKAKDKSFVTNEKSASDVKKEFVLNLIHGLDAKFKELTLDNIQITPNDEDGILSVFLNINGYIKNLVFTGFKDQIQTSLLNLEKNKILEDFKNKIPSEINEFIILKTLKEMTRYDKDNTPENLSGLRVDNIEITRQEDFEGKLDFKVNYNSYGYSFNLSNFKTTKFATDMDNLTSYEINYKLRDEEIVKDAKKYLPSDIIKNIGPSTLEKILKKIEIFNEPGLSIDFKADNDSGNIKIIAKDGVRTHQVFWNGFLTSNEKIVKELDKSKITGTGTKLITVSDSNLASSVTKDDVLNAMAVKNIKGASASDIFLDPNDTDGILTITIRNFGEDKKIVIDGYKQVILDLIDNLTSYDILNTYRNLIISALPSEIKKETILEILKATNPGLKHLKLNDITLTPDKSIGKLDIFVNYNSKLTTNNGKGKLISIFGFWNLSVDTIQNYTDNDFNTKIANPTNQKEIDKNTAIDGINAIKAGIKASDLLKNSKFRVWITAILNGNANINVGNIKDEDILIQADNPAGEIIVLLYNHGPVKVWKVVGCKREPDFTSADATNALKDSIKFSKITYHNQIDEAKEAKATAGTFVFGIRIPSIVNDNWRIEYSHNELREDGQLNIEFQVIDITIDKDDPSRVIGTLTIDIDVVGISKGNALRDIDVSKLNIQNKATTKPSKVPFIDVWNELIRVVNTNGKTHLTPQDQENILVLANDETGEMKIIFNDLGEIIEHIVTGFKTNQIDEINKYNSNVSVIKYGIVTSPREWLPSQIKASDIIKALKSVSIYFRDITIDDIIITRDDSKGEISVAIKGLTAVYLLKGFKTTLISNIEKMSLSALINKYGDATKNPSQIITQLKNKLITDFNLTALPLNEITLTADDISGILTINIKHGYIQRSFTLQSFKGDGVFKMDDFKKDTLFNDMSQLLPTHYSEADIKATVRKHHTATSPANLKITVLQNNLLGVIELDIENNGTTKKYKVHGFIYFAVLSLKHMTVNSFLRPNPDFVTKDKLASSISKKDVVRAFDNFSLSFEVLKETDIELEANDATGSLKMTINNHGAQKIMIINNFQTSLEYSLKKLTTKNIKQYNPDFVKGSIKPSSITKQDLLDLLLNMPTDIFPEIQIIDISDIDIVTNDETGEVIMTILYNETSYKITFNGFWSDTNRYIDITNYWTSQTWSDSDVGKKLKVVLTNGKYAVGTISKVNGNYGVSFFEAADVSSISSYGYNSLSYIPLINLTRDKILERNLYDCPMGNQSNVGWLSTNNVSISKIYIEDHNTFDSRFENITSTWKSKTWVDSDVGKRVRMKFSNSSNSDEFLSGVLQKREGEFVVAFTGAQFYNGTTYSGFGLDRTFYLRGINNSTADEVKNGLLDDDYYGNAEWDSVYTNTNYVSSFELEKTNTFVVASRYRTWTYNDIGKQIRVTFSDGKIMAGYIQKNGQDFGVVFFNALRKLKQSQDVGQVYFANLSDNIYGYSYMKGRSYYGSQRVKWNGKYTVTITKLEIKEIQ